MEHRTVLSQGFRSRSRRSASEVRLFLSALLALAAVTASAQGVVQQSGPITPYHSTTWQANGQVQDGGTLQTPTTGALGIFSATPCTGSTSSPFGVTSATTPGQTLTPYTQFTVCPTSSTITLYFVGVNGAGTPTVYFNVGGVNYAFPGSGSGNVNGPVSSVSGDLASFNGTAGNLLADSGIPFQGVANSLLGNATGSTAAWASVTVPSCHGTNEALTWTSASGFGCATIAGSGTGTVTNVATGSGLTGGPCTTTCTLSATTVLNAQTGTTYTVLSTDSAGIVTLSNSSSIAVTLPQATGSFGAGFATTLCDSGTGAVTITPTTSTINGASTYALQQGNCVTPVSDGSNYSVIPSQGQKNGIFTNLTGTNTNSLGSYSLNAVLAVSATPPTIASGFGTSPSVVASNGTLAFTVNVGTSNTGTGVLTMPTAAHGWACHINDITTKSTTVASTQVTVTTTTSVTVQNYSDVMGTHDWVDSDVLQFLCVGY
jgi:hypothetical protein